MKKKIIATLMAILLCLTCTMPASAWTFRFGSRRVRFVCAGSACSQTQKSTTAATAAQPSSSADTSATDTSADDTSASEVSVSSSSAVLAYEQEVVTLVNRQRAANGLPALTLDETLCRYARVKSQDMHDAGYFSHTSPTYGTPFEMMKSFGISYQTAGENIAMGYSSPEAVVTAWMNSAGHRANILSSAYTKIGVGYVADGGYWTQWFVG